MKTNEMLSVIKIDQKNFIDLVTEVKETVLSETHCTIFPDDKKFGVIDLWNSEKNMRTAVSRRRHHPKAF